MRQVTMESSEDGLGARRVIDWGPIRVDYESRTDGSLDVANRNGVSRSALLARAKAEGWQRHGQARADRAHIIARLFRLLDQQVLDLESEMKELGRKQQRSGEKEIVILGKLAGHLDKLIAIEAKAIATKPGEARPSKEMESIQAMLAERIARLQQG